MNWLRRQFCRHHRVDIRRTHNDSTTGRKVRRLTAAGDESCVIYVVCHDCGKVFEAASEPLHKTVWNHEPSGRP